MAEAYIVDATRTAVGKRGGGFADRHPRGHGGPRDRHTDRPARLRSGRDRRRHPGLPGQSRLAGRGDIARTAALAAGLPESVPPGVTIDRQCGSAQQAIHFAAQAVMSGTSDLIVAGGVQKMSQYPILCAFGAGEPYGSSDPWTGCEGWEQRYGTQEVSQFRAAEMIADKWGVSREDCEHYAFRSHQRALAAIDAGYFTREISEYAGVTTDEGPRRDTSLEKLAGLKPLSEGGKVTAGVASQISDASAALLIASEDAVNRFGFTPRARIHHMSVRGADPIMMLTAPPSRRPSTHSSAPA